MAGRRAWVISPFWFCCWRATAGRKDFVGRYTTHSHICPPVLTILGRCRSQSLPGKPLSGMAGPAANGYLVKRASVSEFDPRAPHWWAGADGLPDFESDLIPSANLAHLKM